MPKQNVKTADIKAHWDAVAQLGCIVTGQPATIAHCHGGSIIDELGYDWQPGWSQRQNHWLVIPLSKEAHQGSLGLDTYEHGVRAWEELYNRQTILLEYVSHLLHINVYKMAGYDRRFETARPYEIPM